MKTSNHILTRQLLLASALVSSGAALMAQTKPPAAAPQQPAAQPAAQTANTPYSIGAQRNGVAKCIGRINQISNFVTGNNANSGLVLTAPAPNANQRIVSSLMEIEGGGTTSFVSASYAPGADNTECSGTYEAVTYWTASCAQVASSNFNTFKATRPLLKAINVLDGGQFAKVFLMPAGSGCVSIKKEVLY